MAAEAQAFGRQAFELIADLDSLSSADAVMERMGRAISRFGFEWFVFTGLVPQPGQELDDLILAGRFPPGFRSLYTSREYVRFDPNVRRSIRSPLPFEWSWMDYGDECGPRAVEIMRFFADFRVTRGFIVPVHGSGGHEAGAAMAGTRIELPAQAKPALHLMTLYAFERLRQLVAAKAEEGPPLTNREREVLAWSAQGKSAWEIGEILNLTKRTIDEHAQTATRKLGAANRTHAVAIALRHRLFEV